MSDSPAPTPSDDIRRAIELLRERGDEQTFRLLDRLDFIAEVLRDDRNQCQQAEHGTGDAAALAFSYMAERYERLAEEAQNVTERTVWTVVADQARAMAGRAS